MGDWGTGNTVIETVGRHETSRRLEEVQGLELWHLGRDRFDDFNEFVWGVYREAFVEGSQIPFSLEDIVHSSEEHFDSARVCAVIHPDGTILGTWGLILKEKNDNRVLPIQKEFGLSTAEILETLQAPRARFLFNGWRTAVDKHALEAHGLAANRSVFVFDLLLRGLTEGFLDPEQFVGVAEMEMLVLKYHRRVDIPWQILGEAHHFWGRDRYPCGFRLSEMVEIMRTKYPERYRFLYGREKQSEPSGAG